ncbi:hypothetical protein AB0K40_17775 [Nonomuraea bangladeshensis]|uniref:Uncharacterized protein n=1 Tax=Nonomuraea bangladeshensis TaxID=404385 RepID=A0ABV3H4A6_9ACTN
MDRYQVVAPYVTVPTMTQRGQQVVGLGKGAFVPEDASKEWVERHLRKKMIEKLPAPASPARNEEVPPPPPAAPPASDTPQAPPESGPGSGKQAWVDYAVARGMDRDEANDMTRDDLIAALREE